MIKQFSNDGDFKGNGSNNESAATEVTCIMSESLFNMKKSGKYFM